jgi:hypothetical protein
VRQLACLVAVLLLSAPLNWSKPKEKPSPSWVKEVATREVPVYSGKIPAVVLLNERKVKVDADGMVTTVTRYAVKILNHEGKDEAEVIEYYEKGGRQVKDLRAWLVASNGFVQTFEKETVEDLGAYNEDLYNDIRLRRIRVPNPEVGSVFVYQSEVAQKATEAQDRYVFQDNLPVIESRYSLTVPDGWHARGRVLNADPVEPSIDGNTFTWSLKKLPYREREEFAPGLSGTAPTLAIDFEPPATISDPPTFKNWSDVSRWHSRIADGQADSSLEMQAKVRELTSASSDDYQRVRAIGHFVQRFRYIEISMDLSNNGGVRPHLATQVFSRQYGDCKDKANLMRAMLKVAGIDSYPVVLYSGDRTHVRKEWASPSQFNHMIIAVRLQTGSGSPSVVQSPLGPLLLFDPTDEKTPVGDLPIYEQGSYGLLCAGERGALLSFPVIQPDVNLLSEEYSASLDEQGSLAVSLLHRSSGQSARRDRSLSQSGSAEEYKSLLERRLSRYAKGISLGDVKTQDQYEQNCFSLDLRFTASHYAQMMQGRMLVLNLAVAEPPAMHLPSNSERLQPVLLDGRLYRKRVEVQLPSGFAVDEMPAPYHLESSFARFTLAYRQEKGALILEEELRTETVTLLPSDYPAIKKFFDSVLGADSQSAILVKR